MAFDIKKLREKITAMNIIRVGGLVLLVVPTWFMFKTVAHTVRTLIENWRLESEIAYYQEILDHDRAMLENFGHREFVETYARENYDMNHPGETVYIVRDK